jgi:hypothetical protein
MNTAAPWWCWKENEKFLPQSTPRTPRGKIKLKYLFAKVRIANVNDHIFSFEGLSDYVDSAFSAVSAVNGY